jgi:hypothetical protein
LLDAGSPRFADTQILLILGHHPSTLRGLDCTQRKGRILAIKKEEERFKRRSQEEKKKSLSMNFSFSSFCKSYFANIMLNFDLLL